MEAVTKRIAVVTGSNTGIGFEICRQLASKGVTVVLTARDVKRGLEAVEKINQSGYDNVVFHLLDVANPSSIHSLARFIKNRFGKLDILVNNAGIGGLLVDADVLSGFLKDGVPIKWNEILSESHELAEKCLQTNYYGAKTMCEALIPLLQLSDSPRIVNVSSSAGKLKNVPNKYAKGVLSNVKDLTEERVDELLKKYLNHFQDGTLGEYNDSKEEFQENDGWRASASAYIMSKAALNAYTRILAKKYSNFLINCVCPGYVKTNMTYNSGVLTPEEGAETPVWLALLPKDGPSGLFFLQKKETPFD